MTVRGRAILQLALFATTVCLASPARAAQIYLLTGKFARSNGVALDIPLVGDNPGGIPNCGHTTMGGAMIPGMTPIRQGYRSTITMTMIATPPITMTMFANPRGCISVAGKFAGPSPNVLTGMGGWAFTVPTRAIYRPHPGTPVVVGYPTRPVGQRASTSFEVSGPPMAINALGTAPPNGTMNNGMNTAKFRYFHRSAWLSQTGRAGAKFTWCFGNAACTMASQGMGVDKKGDPNLAYPVHQAIVKYTPGPNKFGGTMSHILTQGPNPSRAAITVFGAAFFRGVPGTGSQVTGRGYADFRTTPIMGGPAYAMFTVTPSGTKFMTPIPAPGSSLTVATRKAFGFPFTTGTVLARNTGTDLQKNPVVVTLTGMGGEAMTAMGARNFSLVAGGVSGVDAFASEEPTLNQIFLPEPGGAAQLAAAAGALLALAMRARGFARRSAVAQPSRKRVTAISQPNGGRP